MIPIRLTVSEAARLFGIDAKTIRRAIKKGELQYVVIRGRYRINFESVLKWSQRRPKISHKLAQAGIGLYVDRWKLSTPLYSPNPKRIEPKNVENPPSTDVSETPPLVPVIPLPPDPNDE
ncbi:MAG: helix-turn-helix domain-containing protein [Patescibacteria group bacterium]